MWSTVTNNNNSIQGYFFTLFGFYSFLMRVRSGKKKKKNPGVSQYLQYIHMYAHPKHSEVDSHAISVFLRGGLGEGGWVGGGLGEGGGC